MLQTLLYDRWDNEISDTSVISARTFHSWPVYYYYYYYYYRKKRFRWHHGLSRRYRKKRFRWHHGLSRRYDGSHHHECDLLWARSPNRERHIRWQIWHSKLLVDGGPDLRRSRLASNSWMRRTSNSSTADLHVKCQPALMNSTNLLALRLLEASYFVAVLFLSSNLWAIVGYEKIDVMCYVLIPFYVTASTMRRCSNTKSKICFAVAMGGLR